MSSEIKYVNRMAEIAIATYARVFRFKDLQIFLFVVFLIFYSSIDKLYLWK